MAEQFAEQSYLEKTRLWFPEGVAPFGELNFVRADHGIDGQRPAFNHIETALKVRADDIVRDSWSQSEWLKNELDEASLTTFAKHEKWDKVDEAITQALSGAAIRPDAQSAWFAVRPPSKELERGDALLKGLGQFIMPSQVVGFANAKHDVSGNLLEQAIKRRTHPEKIYAAVSNVAIMSDEQRKYIGTSLLYISLGLFRPEQHPTTYVAASNEALVSKLDDLGYQSTGSQIRKDLVPGAEIEEIRLQAQSVSEVRKKLATQFPWLEKAIPAHPTWRP